MHSDLFDDAETNASASPSNTLPALNADLHQWFTPAWAAQAIVEQEFGWLKPGHRVVEPSCGDGAFLCAIPSEVEAIGVEIDPAQAAAAMANSGRQVIVGDFLAIDTERLGKLQAIIGNPPFEAALVARFLERSAGLLEDGGQAGFILPAYILQTSSKVEQLSSQFSVHQKLLPRNLFPRLKLPLVFARFVKEHHRRLFGFLLYREAQELAEMHKPYRNVAAAARDRRGAWFRVVHTALQALGGEAELSTIYATVAKTRPTGNQFWKEKIRQTLQRSEDFCRTGPGRYCLASSN